ncbi:MAG: hypothetical protein QOC60_1475, partial [Frankiaceae bacterium]|nr:hypothetical protein [Frankiaceae bacterium]
SNAVMVPRGPNHLAGASQASTGSQQTAATAGPSQCPSATPSPGASSFANEPLQQYAVTAEESHDPNFTGVAIYDGCLWLYWHGTPNQAVQQVITQAQKAGITVIVVQRGWTRNDVLAVHDRILADKALVKELGVSGVSQSEHEEGIDIGLAGDVTDSRVQEAMRKLQPLAPGIPLHVSALNMTTW